MFKYIIYTININNNGKNYKEGDLDGKQVSYYEKGQLKYEKNYKEGN